MLIIVLIYLYLDKFVFSTYLLISQLNPKAPEELKRYFEVKGRSVNDGSVMLSENEMNRLAQLGDAAWLYIVVSCKSAPELFRIQNPAKALKFELKNKGIQYFLPMSEWKNKLIE